MLIAALFAILSSAKFHLYQLRQGTHSNKNPGCDRTVLIGRNPVKCKTALADPMAIESTSRVSRACCHGKSPFGMTPSLAHITSMNAYLVIAVQQKRPLYYSEDEVMRDITNMLVIMITSTHQNLALYS